MDLKKFFRIGTPLCGITLGLIGVMIAFLFLFLGFWRTLFVALFFAAGYFIGASSDKAESLKRAINKLFPPKNE